MIKMKYLKNSLLSIMATLFLGAVISTHVYAQAVILIPESCTDTCEATGVNTTPYLEEPSYPDGTDSDSHDWSNDIPAEGLPLGTHTVTWTLTSVSDSSFTYSVTQSITIVDTTAPEFEDNYFVENILTSTGLYTAITSELLGGTPEVNDTVDPDVSVTLLGTINTVDVTQEKFFNLYLEILPELYVDYVPTPFSDSSFFTYSQTFIDRDPELFEQLFSDAYIEYFIDRSLSVTTGFYSAIWKAEDESGNISYPYGVFLVVPTVSILQSPTAVIGGEAEITIVLNGKQVDSSSFEIELTGTVIDKINDSDNDNDDIYIYLDSDEVEGTAYFSIPDDVGITTSDTLFATIVYSSDYISISEEQNSISIPLTDQNIAPRVELSSYLEGDCNNFPLPTNLNIVNNVASKCSFTEQINGLTFQASEASHYVAVSANVVDEDATTLKWEVTGAPFQEDGNLIGFLPVDATSSIVTVKLTVTDTDGLMTTKSLDILLTSSPVPTLTSDDTDGDGTSDEDEGTGDSDGDGIADYLDDNPLTNLLPLGDDNDPMFVQSGVSLTLGTTKRSADGLSADDATVSDGDLANYGDEGGSTPNNTTDSDFPVENRVSPIIDFEVTGFTAGETIDIVIPLPSGVLIPDDAEYRKYTSANGWNDFVIDADNALASSPLTSNSTCPDTDSTDYTSGLTEGDACIRLSIEDGGPNDADFEVNGTIVDPGVLTVAVVEDVVDTTPVVVPINTTTTTVTVTTPDNSSGGGTGLLILLLLPLTVFRLRKQTK